MVYNIIIFGHNVSEEVGMMNTGVRLKPMRSKTGLGLREASERFVDYSINYYIELE